MLHVLRTVLLKKQSCYLRSATVRKKLLLYMLFHVRTIMIKLSKQKIKACISVAQIADIIAFKGLRREEKIYD